MTQLALTGASIYSPFQIIEDGIILIRDTKIELVGSSCDVVIPDGYRRVPLEGLIIAPGFIDIHSFGCEKALFNDGNPASLADLSRYQAVHGVTSFLITTDLNSFADLTRIAQSFAALSRSDYKGARCLGIHLEQSLVNSKNAFQTLIPSIEPFLSIEELLELHKISEEGIKLMSVAPEIKGVLDTAEILKDEGIVLSILHSNASYEIADKAMKTGFSGISLCFQNEWLIKPTDPGVVGAALTMPELTVAVIGDLTLLHPAFLNLLWMTKGAGGLILTSNFKNQPETFNQQDSFRGKTSGLENILTIENALTNFLKVTKCKITEGLRLVTYNPARFLGINKKKGSLYPGKDADLVVMTSDFEVVMTMVEGEVISGLISL